MVMLAMVYLACLLHPGGDPLMLNKPVQKPWPLLGKVISPAARFHHHVETYMPTCLPLDLLGAKEAFVIHGPPKLSRQAVAGLLERIEYEFKVNT